MSSQEENKAISLTESGASFFNIYLQSEWKTSSSSYLFAKNAFCTVIIDHILYNRIGSIIKTRIMRRVSKNNGLKYNI